MPHTGGDLLKLAALLFSLGLDTFAVAIGLGIAQLGRRQRLRLGASFALAEGLMPIVGLLLGQRVAGPLGRITSYAAIVLLLAVGLYTLWEARQGEEAPQFGDMGAGKLILTVLSVSLDELAIGFSLGLLGVPAALAVVLIAAQAFLLTMVGSAIGRRIGEEVAEGAELLSGAALTGLAGILLVEKLVGS